MSEYLAPIDGVYALFDKRTCVYIGQSNNCIQRIGRHIEDKNKKFDDYRTFSLADLKICKNFKNYKDMVEDYLIHSLSPKFNIRGSHFEKTPLTRKNICIQYIQDYIDTFIEYALICEENNEPVCEDPDMDIMRKYNLKYKKMCVCKDCAYYYANVYANEWYIRGANVDRYLNACSCSKINHKMFLYPDDGCTHGLPMTQTNIYRRPITDEERAEHLPEEKKKRIKYLKLGEKVTE